MRLMKGEWKTKRTRFRWRFKIDGMLRLGRMQWMFLWFTYYYLHWCGFLDDIFVEGVFFFFVSIL